MRQFAKISKSISVRRKLASSIVAMVVSLAAPPALHAQTKGGSLPGGASSLKENFQDWQVSCGIVANSKQCVMSQQQRQKESNRLVMAAEFAATAKDGSGAGTLVLPFGLLVSSGVTLQVDDKPPPPAFAFRTCLPNGCIVPLKLDKAALTAMKSGGILKVSAPTTQDKTLTLSISLKGFVEAQDRLNQLMN